MGRVIGIDLGTSNSVMAIMDKGKPTIIPNAEGQRITPSVVGLDPNTHQLIAGIAAKRQTAIDPENTVYSIKRFVGRRYSSPAIQNDIKLAPYKIHSSGDGKISVQIGEKAYSPAEILAVILSKLRNDAETYLGETVKDAVITVPAYFFDLQRQAIKNAGSIAGLNVLRIINESTAAALACWLHKKADSTVAVYHMGAGTFDISILEVGDNVFEVKSTNGNTHLGGDDFDQRIINWVCDEVENMHGIDLRQNRLALQRLKWEAEKAKCDLSFRNHTEINLPYINTEGGSPRDLLLGLSKEKLKQLVNDLVEMTLDPCKQALKDSGLSLRDIDEVILAGQQIRMPAIPEVVSKLFGREPWTRENPAEVVALGAAVQAGILAGELKDVLLLDVTPFSLGIETKGGVTTRLIYRNTTIPTRNTEIFTTAEDNQTAIEILVLQGEREMAKDNIALGKFQLDGILPAPHGKPQIEVTFDIDSNGVVNISAKDLATGREQKLTFEALRLEAAKDRNNALAMIDEANMLLSNQGGKLNIHLRYIVDYKLAELHTALQNTDLVMIPQTTEELGKLLLSIKILENSDNLHTEYAAGPLIGLLINEKNKHNRETIRKALRDIGGAKVEEFLKPRTWTEKLLGHRPWVDD